MSPSDIKIGRRSTRRKLFIGIELPGGGLHVLYTVDIPYPSKYIPHQGAREKARRLRKQQEK